MALEPNILQKAISLGAALLTGTDVGKERMEKRLEVCSQCPAMKLVKEQMICGLCGCKIKGGERALINLARYEETTLYGCKYKGGSKWKQAGV